MKRSRRIPESWGAPRLLLTFSKGRGVNRSGGWSGFCTIPTPGRSAARSAHISRAPSRNVAHTVTRDNPAYPDEAQARTAILERKFYGAVLLNPVRPADFKVLTASAGGPAVAQLLTGMGNQIGTLMAASGFAAPAVEDVVPTAADDPRQATLAAIVLPLVITGYVSGFLLPTRLPRRRERIGATGVVALIVGFSFASVIQFGFQTIAGSFLTNGLVFSLAVGAVVALPTDSTQAAFLAWAGSDLQADLSQRYSAVALSHVVRWTAWWKDRSGMTLYMHSV